MSAGEVCKGKTFVLVFNKCAYLRFINIISEQFAEVITKKENIYGEVKPYVQSKNLKIKYL